MSERKSTWDAWIDVGGTFTDCYVRDNQGRVSRLKTLSSGKVLVSVQRMAADRFFAPEVQGDATNFWSGARVTFYGEDSSELASSRVLAATGGWLTLQSSLSLPGLAVRAELDAGCEAPVLAVQRLLGIRLQDSLPPLRVRLGTTKGTNALLTRRGARTALAITAPFEDLLEIGDQTRPKLFELAIRKPSPLAELCVGIHERLAADGSVLQPLDEVQAREALLRAKHVGCESLAICLMHAYVNPAHEQQLVQIANSLGFENVSLSSQLAPLIEIVARAQTTVVDAYLNPIIRSYLAKLVEQLGGVDSVQLHVMTSAGGLAAWQDYSGKDSILSGPAGGVAALRSLAAASPHQSIIGLDMGGTSTDVCRVSDEHNLQYESTKAGVRILTPTLPIETVASGGGSVCWFDGVSLRVGPHSAGASPGPACYGQGGPLTVTDLNVFLGRIPTEQFLFPLDLNAVEQRLQELFEATAQQFGLDNFAQLATGFRRIANEQMAEAVRTVSISQGADPRAHALVGFGGAAGQHICEIAEALAIPQVIDSAEAGLLSALGMGMADRRLDAVFSLYQPLDQVDWTTLQLQVQSAEAKLIEQFEHQGQARETLSASPWLELRYAKTDSSLTLPWPEHVQEVQQAFALAHRTRYGYARPLGTPIELVAVRIEVVAASPNRLPVIEEAEVAHALSPNVNGWPQWRRQNLQPGQTLAGPAIVLNAGSTLVVEAGWIATCSADGLLYLKRQVAPESNRSREPGDLRSNFDPVFRDCFAQRLSAIATQMGVVLQQTAVSVNVKQRRDFSCAIFDARGQLLANAPHVPVHLGAMGGTIESIVAEFPDMREGDSFVTNDPYRGGSHLPDVTVITPVFLHQDKHTPTLVFFVANRAHHADIGGIAPGSMSVKATRLGEEGVVIAPRRLVAAGEDCSPELRRILANAEFPPRNIDENLADMTAQLAANTRGATLLRDYARSVSWEVLEVYCGHLLDAAESRLHNFLVDSFSGTRKFADFLDDGTKIQVAISSPAQGQLTIDFSGSGPVSATNLNANPWIVKAAVIYVLRCLIADELPLNDGIMRCVNLIVPTGILHPAAHANPAQSPAVAAGNVETSQRVVDVLLGAFGAAAASQGTMNNLLFGNEQFGFYETICGGSGATRGHAGVSGVHTHMTNTRLTDPEVLEWRYPVRLVSFGIHRGSGGRGRWPGGDGVVRVIEFLDSVELSLLTSRRGAYAPFGLEGGSPGQLGANALIKADGTRRQLGSCFTVSFQPGDRLEIKTPGGGGFGRQIPCLTTDYVAGSTHFLGSER